MGSLLGTDKYTSLYTTAKVLIDYYQFSTHLPVNSMEKSELCYKTRARVPACNQVYQTSSFAQHFITNHANSAIPALSILPAPALHTKKYTNKSVFNCLLLSTLMLNLVICGGSRNAASAACSSSVPARLPACN